MARTKDTQSKAPCLRLVANNGRVISQKRTGRTKAYSESLDGVSLATFLEQFKTKIPDELCAVAVRYARGDIAAMRITTLASDGEIKSHSFGGTQ